MIAMTTIKTAITGPIEDFAKNNGWEKTARNPAICVAMVEVSYPEFKLLCLTMSLYSCRLQ